MPLGWPAWVTAFGGDARAPHRSRTPPIAHPTDRTPPIGPPDPVAPPGGFPAFATRGNVLQMSDRSRKVAKPAAAFGVLATMASIWWFALRPRRKHKPENHTSAQ